MKLRELYSNAYYKNNKGFLLNGDCVELLKKIDEETIDLTVTSPPYDDLRKYSNGYSFDFEGVAKELFRVTKTGGGSVCGLWAMPQRMVVRVLHHLSKLYILRKLDLMFLIQ